MKSAPFVKTLAILAAINISAICCTNPNQLIQQPAWPSASQPAGFSEEDRKVLEAVLISLITDPDYYPSDKRRPIYDSIGLCEKLPAIPPRSLGYLLVCPETSGLTLPALIEFDKRNAAAHRLPQDGWDPRIRVVDPARFPRRDPRLPEGETFEKSYPTTRGLVSARLPCYLADRSHAYVLIGFKAGSHGAEVEFSVVKIDGEWRVQKRRFTYYR